MIAFALLALLVGQDTVPDLSPRARAMLDAFPLPRPGQPSIVTRFSSDSVWVGEQVELLTAAWFPRDLRERLRTQPTLRPPSSSGLWSAQAQPKPQLVRTRRAGADVFDLYILHQTHFPLAPGRVVSSAAELMYLLPKSASFFAPEDRKLLQSRATRLTVLPIPAALARELGSGPTARDLRLVWRGPVGGFKAGVPAEVELVVTGQGNTPLWPAPEIVWPTGLRVYPERTEERAWMIDGWHGGEKRFRFTVVADSAGVATLPSVRYPYFDPRSVSVPVASAAPFTLPVLPGGAAVDRKPLPVVASGSTPLATRVVGTGWPVLLLLAAWPAFARLRRRPRRRPRAPSAPSDAEQELRLLLGAPLEAGPERVATALRRRGVTRDDAEQVRRWLAATTRRRYGTAPGDGTLPPPAVEQVLARLRGALLALLFVAGLVGSAVGQARDGVTRYRDGDVIGAARLFAGETEAAPDRPHAWRNLAAARWLGGDDVGAAAAWLRTLALAPRDGLARDAWRDATTIPADVRRLAPSIPVSRDEAVLVALLAWLAAWALRRTRRRVALVVFAVAVAAGGLAGVRTREDRAGRGLVRTTTPLRVSPHPAAPVLGEAGAWGIARIQRIRGSWVLVTVDRGRQGWVPATTVAPLGPLD